MNWEQIMQVSALSGGILYLMPILLFVALAVAFERTLALARCVQQGRRLSEAVAQMNGLDRQAIRQITEGAAFPFRTLLEVPLRFPQVNDAGRLSELLQESIMRQVPELDRRLWVLDTVVTLAPLLGLLGTIVGMFHTFQFLDGAGANPTAITGSVAEALIATAAGLVIAIVGLVAFNGLHNRVRFVVHQMETLRTMLVNRMAGLDHPHALEDGMATPLIYAATEA